MCQTRDRRPTRNADAWQITLISSGSGLRNLNLRFAHGDGIQPAVGATNPGRCPPRTHEAGARLAALTAKWRGVLEGIATGKSNRERTAELGRIARAVGYRRARLMRKVSARSVAALIRLLMARRAVAVLPRAGCRVSPRPLVRGPREFCSPSRTTRKFHREFGSCRMLIAQT